MMDVKLQHNYPLAAAKASSVLFDVSGMSWDGVVDDDAPAPWCGFPVDPVKSRQAI